MSVLSKYACIYYFFATEAQKSTEKQTIEHALILFFL